jgi:hypothetical protein
MLVCRVFPSQTFATNMQIKMAKLALFALFAAHALAQSTSDFWIQPTCTTYYAEGLLMAFGSNVDVNGDGLPDIVQQMHYQTFYGATYLNTGRGYCIAYETPSSASDRISQGGVQSNIPHCSSVPSMNMHEPKEDKRVTGFLTLIDLGEYAPAFAEHKVDYETLVALTDAELEKMGVAAVGARKRILRATKQAHTTSIATA